MEHYRAFFVVEPGTAHELCSYSLEVCGRTVMSSSSSGAVQRYFEQQRQKQHGARNLWVWPEGLTGCPPEVFMVYVYQDGHVDFVVGGPERPEHPQKSPEHPRKIGQSSREKSARAPELKR